MAVSNNYVPIKQIGDGGTVNFSSISWTILAASYLKVYLEDTTTGLQTLQNLGSDYTLVFSSAGFTVTFAVAPPITKYVVISRSTSLDQTNPYKTSSGYQGGVLEDSLDKLTDIAQENYNNFSRSLSFPIGDTTSGALPTVAARKGLFLYFDATTGAPMVGGTAGSAVSSAMLPVVGASTLALARAAFGLGTAATQNIGSAGANVPLLNAANTWALAQDFTTRPTIAGVGVVDISATQTLSNKSLVGRTDAAATAAGNIGEVLTAQLTAGSATSLTSATPKNITSQTYSAGWWDIEGVGALTSAATTSYTQKGVSLSLTSNTAGAAGDQGVFVSANAANVNGGFTESYPTGKRRFYFASPTTVYLVAVGTFAVSTSTAYGSLSGTRVQV